MSTANKTPLHAARSGHSDSRRALGEIPSSQAFLAKADPAKTGVAVCTVSGQQFAYGDAEDEFPLQAVGRSLLYCIAQELCGEEEVHRYIGKEPGPHPYNAIVVDSNNKPYNPFYNAGALVNHSMINAEGAPTSCVLTICHTP